MKNITVDNHGNAVMPIGIGAYHTAINTFGETDRLFGSACYLDGLGTVVDVLSVNTRYGYVGLTREICRTGQVEGVFWAAGNDATECLDVYNKEGADALYKRILDLL